MSFIETIAKADAEGATKEIYDAAEASAGYLPHYVELFSHRPEVYKAWQGLLTSIRKHMRLRRYELVTLAAAHALKCSYCMLAHGDVLLNSGEVDEVQLAEIATDYHEARLSADEVAIMDFAAKVIADAGSVTQAEVDGLKSFGLTDAEILDITLAASARSFFSKTLDALDAKPDAKYAGMNADLRAVLAVGRPFEAE